ncbi:DUF92 domain-containing protein [Chloroflexota bacterium]
MAGQMLIGLLFSALIAGLGYWRRALTVSGAAGAILVGTVIFGLGGWVWGLLLVTFFISSSWLSHYRRADKQVFTKELAGDSRRDLGQTLANGGLGAVLALVYAGNPDPLLMAAFVGVMGTVTADTWATELGVLSRVPPRLITTGEPVAPGASGGVTGLGTWASVAGALLIGAVATALTQLWSLLNHGTLSTQAISLPLIAVSGGLVGSLFDSLLGATVQGVYFCEQCGRETESPVHHCGQTTRPVRGWRWMNNDVVNFLASCVGGLVAALLARLLWS